MALKGFSVFAAEQIRIDSNFAAAQSQTKYFIRQRKIISDRVTLWISCELQMPPPVFSSTHARNFSFGTMSREPMRNDGKPFSCISSYAEEMAMPSAFEIVSAFKYNGRSS